MLASLRELFFFWRNLRVDSGVCLGGEQEQREENPNLKPEKVEVVNVVSRNVRLDQGASRR